MAYYLSEQEVFDAFKDDEKDAKLLFEQFDEIERVADAKPKPQLPKGFTGVTDGSLAADLRKIPKENLSQLFTGNITAIDRDEAWVAEIANLVLTKKIIPNANFEDTFFNKQLDWQYRANKYGSQPMYAFQSVTEEYAGANCVLPYIRNVILESGKVSDLASNRIYLVQYYNKYTIKSIIDEAEKENKKAKKDKRDNYGQWDVKQLKRLLETATSTKEAYEQNPVEREHNLNTGRYKIIHCFQRGSNAPFYSFAPALGNEDNIVRRAKNTNPTGDMPIIFLYSDIERINPYGLGIGALALPNQNVQDAMTQAHVFETFKGLRPPIRVKGNRSRTVLSSLVWGADKLWLTGDADVDTVRSDSSIYSQFPTAMGFYKTQGQKITGSRDGAVSASSGDPNFSKTSAGVKENVRSNSVDANFLINRHEQAYERLITTMVNIHMANMHNTELLKITQDEAAVLDKAGMLLDKNGDGVITSEEVLVEYEKTRAKFKFTVDANSSKEKSDAEDADELAGMTETVTALSKMPPKIQFGQYEFDTGEFANVIFRKKGLPDIDKFLKKLTPENMNAAGETEPNQDITARIQQIVETHGLHPELAAQVAQMESRGVDPQEIVNFVQSQEAMA